MVRLPSKGAFSALLKANLLLLILTVSGVAFGASFLVDYSLPSPQLNAAANVVDTPTLTAPVYVALNAELLYGHILRSTTLILFNNELAATSLMFGVPLAFMSGIRLESWQKRHQSSFAQFWRLRRFQPNTYKLFAALVGLIYMRLMPIFGSVFPTNPASYQVALMEGSAYWISALVPIYALFLMRPTSSENLYGCLSGCVSSRSSLLTLALVTVILLVSAFTEASAIIRGWN